METKASYVMIGLFMLAVLAGAFGFVYWFQNFGGASQRAYYRLAFDGSVSGLRTGGNVLFNGIRVGEVTRLILDAKHPQQVIATIAIDNSVPVRADTQVGLEYAGVTGIASIALTGGSASAPQLAGSNDNPPLLSATPGAAQDVTQGARDTLRRLNDFIVDNQASFHSTLDNLDKFSGTLARNSERSTRSSAACRTIWRRRRQGWRGHRGGPLDPQALRESEQAHRRDCRRRQSARRAGTKQLNAIGTDARRMIAEVEKAVRNIDQNPSRLIFGGSAAADK